MEGAVKLSVQGQNVVCHAYGVLMSVVFKTFNITHDLKK